MKKMLTAIIILACFFVGHSFSEDASRIVCNKEYHSTVEPTTLIINENTMKYINLYDLSSKATIYNSKLYNDGFFTYLERESIKSMVFTCSINDVHFLNLVSHYAGETASFLHSISSQWVYAEAENWGVLKGVTVKNATSFLTETINNEKVAYLPETWGFAFAPWAVSIKAEQKNITFSCTIENWDNDSYIHEKVDTLVISNGFVMPSKPHLYEQNCRAKTIRIRVNGKTIEHTLEDTPNYQLVALPESFYPNPSTMVELEIVDWYEGTKYDDIVIAEISYPMVRYNNPAN